MSDELSLIQQAAISFPMLWPYITTSAEAIPGGIGKAIGDGIGKAGLEKAGSLIKWSSGKVAERLGSKALESNQPPEPTDVIDLFKQADTQQLQALIELASLLSQQSNSQGDTTIVNGDSTVIRKEGDTIFNIGTVNGPTAKEINIENFTIKGS